MASQILTNTAQPLPHAEQARTEQEIAFLTIYRQADEANKRRIVKLLRAAIAGTLPPPEVRAKWSHVDLRMFADALPEVQ